MLIHGCCVIAMVLYVVASMLLSDSQVPPKYDMGPDFSETAWVVFFFVRQIKIKSVELHTKAKY